MIFELLTAEYLFDPQSQGEMFTKDDDHMAQIIELLGDFSTEAKMGGKYSRELFDHSGNYLKYFFSNVRRMLTGILLGGMRYIKTLKPWPLKRVMTEKYLFSEPDATALCEFLLPMLTTDFKKRCQVRDMIDHPWLDVTGEAIGDW